MNYLSEINAFERWLETNYLPASSQLLWYKLMMLFNRCRWAEWIAVDNQRLMTLMQMKREATFLEVRNRLIDVDLIKYQKGKKGSPNKYKMNYFTFNNEVQTEVYTEVQTEVETVDINKLKQTKPNNTITTPLPPSQGEQPAQQKNESASQKDMKAELNKVWNDSKSEFSPVLQKEIQDWIRYKKEIKKEYKTLIGFTRFLSQVKKNVQEFGETAVIQIMDSSMANGYQGITWDKLQKTNKEGRHNGRNQGVAENNSGGNFKEGKTDPLAGFKRRTVL